MTATASSKRDTAAVAVVEPNDGATRTATDRDARLIELAEIANQEHASVEGDLRSAVFHSIKAGAAIYEAHESIESYKAWKEWTARSLRFGWSYACLYERLYVYRDNLPPEAFEPYTNTRGRVVQPSTERAMAYLRGLPPIRAIGPAGYPPHVRAEAARLRGEGVPVTAISGLVGASVHQIYAWTTPGRMDKKRAEIRANAARRRKAEAALRREQRAADIRRVGGGVSEVYSNVRKSLQILDHELAKAETPALRRELGGLIADLHKVEDRIGRALRIGQEAA